MTYDELNDFIVDNTCCTYCNADYQKWCVTSSGAKTYYLHAVRAWPIRQAHGAGYTDGVEDGRRWERDVWQRKQVSKTETVFAGKGDVNV